MTERHTLRRGAALALAAAALGAQAQTATLDLGLTRHRYDGGLAAGQAQTLRAQWGVSARTRLSADLLAERKFGERGGLAVLGVTQVLDDDWHAGLSAGGGWGGSAWARSRADLDLSRKWGARRQLVTTLGGYRALFPAGRSDSGLRLSAHYHFEWPLVLEGGTALNRSQPGRVHSRMPYLALTEGREGSHYLSLRYARGNEAWQAFVHEASLVDFDSHSLAVNARWWLQPRWGLTLGAERYRNPYYRRDSVGLGLFLQM